MQSFMGCCAAAAAGTRPVQLLHLALRALKLEVQAFSLGPQLGDGLTKAVTNPYRALYSVLESPEMTRSTKAPMFLSLLFKVRGQAGASRLLLVSSLLFPFSLSSPETP